MRGLPSVLKSEQASSQAYLQQNMLEVIAAIERAFNRIALYTPDVLVVALGLDAARSDPLQGMRIYP
ncbi:MAG: hypothetical protein FGM36_02860 [Burkholderiaceae bacterium]|jgi:acetoin utilization deacetylase AcuC-like enzyme|nr:hypothetical protein [Burkholderiaceae bacterium]